jgi:TonB family protein
MDRSFLLPIAIAATIHGFLFMTDRPATDPIVPPQDTASRPVDDWVVIPIDLLDVIETERTDAPKAPEVPLTKELISTAANAADAITIPALPTPDLPTGPEISRIPTGWRPSAANENGGTLPYSAISLDNPPNARFQPAPVYPAELKPLGLDGRVTVLFSVDVSGKVYNESVVDASHSRFAEEALRAVRRWRFEPGLKDGKRVAFRMAQAFSFNLAE